MSLEDSPMRQEALEKVREVLDSEELLSMVLKNLDDKKCINPVAIRIEEVSSLGDYIVIVTGSSTTHVRVMGESVRDEAKKLGIEMLNVGEKSDDTWNVLDFGSVILHCMNYECREKYRLEEMWKAGETMNVSTFLEKK